MRINSTLRALGVTVLLTLTGTIQAEVAVTFNGVLIEPPPCSIDNEQQIDVDFGDNVGINKVDGIAYRKAINYHISCTENPNGSFALKLGLNGTNADFDANALATGQSDLGIQIYQNDSKFTPNTVLDIDFYNPPLLEAVPVMRQGGTLVEGEFDALATLQAEYQ